MEKKNKARYVREETLQNKSISDLQKYEDEIQKQAQDANCSLSG